MNASLAHVSIGARALPALIAFYTPVLATLGIRPLETFALGTGFGRKWPEFWVQSPENGQPASPGNGVHICFRAADIEAVKAFHAEGLKHGAADNGAPGPRPDYGAHYYGAFLIDPEGNRIEAMCLI